MQIIPLYGNGKVHIINLLIDIWVVFMTNNAAEISLYISLLTITLCPWETVSCGAAISRVLQVTL